MKVAVVTQFPADPESPSGGVEAVSVTLVRALAELGDLELDVVTTDPACGAVARSVWQGVRVHRLPRRGRRVLTDALGAGRRQVARYVQLLGPDLVHAHDTYGLMVQGLPIPRVFTIHGFIHGDTLVSGARLARLRSWIWRWVETAGWADQPCIISISPYVRERLTGIARGVIHDIDNPVSESFFHVARRERPGVIVSAAAVCPRKNTLVLVDAVARLRAEGVHAELRLAGPVTDAAYGRRVADVVRERGLDGQVSLLDGIPAFAVREELAEASVFALVSLEENSPMGIAEAMAAGVPVVTSNRCGMPYMVCHGETGFLVDPRDPADVAGRLASLLADDRRRVAFGEKARAVARERFHPALVARRTRDVYREVVGAGRRGRRAGGVLEVTAATGAAR